MLAQSQVAHYLNQNGLTASEHFVNCDFTVMEASRRNRNFKVLSQHGPCYLLKQGIGSAATETVKHEAAVYKLLRQLPSNSSLLGYIPQFIKYDSLQQILILELLHDAQDFREYSERHGRFSVSIATALGTALSTLHRATIPAIGIAREIGLQDRLPWVLSIHRPGLGIFRDTSSANIQLIRIVQNAAALPLLLDSLRDGWRIDAVTHNDIKWDNCLVFPVKRSHNRLALKLVDWEFANLGDSCWDAGAVFSSYLGSWLLSIPVSGEDPPDQFLDLAQCPLGRMQPAIRAYWRAYACGMNFDAVESEEHLLRAVRYGAARLIQTAYEQMQHSTSLTGNIICLLQLSLNILQRPHEAIAHLLGLSLKA